MGIMDSETPNKVILRRSQQMELLADYLGEDGDQTTPGTFVYGLPATGKTLCIKDTVRRLKHRLVCVDCVEWHSSRLVFEGILRQVDPHYDNSCCSANTFIHHLKHHLPPHSSTYILFERSERLRDMGVCMLPMLLKLQELTALNVGVVLESELLWEKFREGTSVREPLVVHMPEYKRDDLLEIMMLDRPPPLPPATYHNYLSLMLDVHMLSCRNLAELRSLAAGSLARYIEPIATGRVAASDCVALWKNMQHHLATPLNTRTHGLHHHHNSTLELPVYSKYLLIAAYLSSHNPAKLDKRLFVKFSSRAKKSAKECIKKQQRTSSQVLGPKFFTLERHTAIFHSILHHHTPIHTAIIFSQMTSLVELGLLATTSCEGGSLDDRKYKCLLSLPQITSISKSVGFEIIKYLYDFI